MQTIFVDYEILRKQLDAVLSLGGQQTPLIEGLDRFLSEVADVLESDGDCTLVAKLEDESE